MEGKTQSENPPRPPRLFGCSKKKKGELVAGRRRSEEGVVQQQRQGPTLAELRQCHKRCCTLWQRVPHCARPHKHGASLQHKGRFGYMI